MPGYLCASGLALPCGMQHRLELGKEAAPGSQIRTKSALFPSHSGINDYLGQRGRMNHAVCPVHIKPMFFV